MATRTESQPVLTPPITVAQWGELEGPPYYELVDGQLQEKPDVAFWHELLSVALTRFVVNHVYEHKIGLIVTSKAKLKISDYGGREPDLFFIPNALTYLIGKNLFKGVPSLVVEILSPSNERVDRVAKYREYAQLGIGEYWIIDFANRRIEIHRLKPRPDGAYAYELAETIEGEDAIFRPALFPGLEIPLSSVWPTEYEDRTDD